MIMADVFTYLFVILGLLIALVCYWLMFQALFPGRVERARAVLAQTPGRSVVAGVAVAAPLMAVGSGLASLPNGLMRLLGTALILLTVLLALFGTTGLARRIGDGLAAPDDTGAPGRRVLRGGAVLAVTFILPLVGWFVVLPVSLIAGVGAAVLALRDRGSALPQEAAVPPLPTGTTAEGHA